MSAVRNKINSDQAPAYARSQERKLPLMAVELKSGALADPVGIRNTVCPNRVFLAPLAGVSDWPFRRICQTMGAGLTFVEMLSAAAVIQALIRGKHWRIIIKMFLQAGWDEMVVKIHHLPRQQRLAEVSAATKRLTDLLAENDRKRKRKTDRNPPPNDEHSSKCSRNGNASASGKSKTDNKFVLASPKNIRTNVQTS